MGCNAPTIAIGEKAADLIKASRTEQTPIAQYNLTKQFTNKGESSYLTSPSVKRTPATSISITKTTEQVNL
jgi:hypothetical protein